MHSLQFEPYCVDTVHFEVSVGLHWELYYARNLHAPRLVCAKLITWQPIDGIMYGSRMISKQYTILYYMSYIGFATVPKEDSSMAACTNYLHGLMMHRRKVSYSKVTVFKYVVMHNNINCG